MQELKTNCAICNEVVYIECNYSFEESSMQLVKLVKVPNTIIYFKIVIPIIHWQGKICHYYGWVNTKKKKK